MNLLTIRSQARLKSSVSSTDFSNANLDEQLNQAYLILAWYLAALGEDYFEEQNVKFDLVGGSALVSQPSDTMFIKGVRLAYTAPTNPEDYKVASAYDPSSVHDVGADEENISTNNPIYDITNNYIRIKPTPESDVSAGGKLWYIARPSALATTADTPVLPVYLHDKLSDYGGKIMAFKYNKWKKHDRLEKSWKETLDEFDTLLADRDMGQVLRFRSPFEVPVPPQQRRTELPDY